MFSAFDTGQLTGAIFIDLSKAFDIVDHYLLLDKLPHIGLNQNAVLWFNSYFHNRHQYVYVNGCQSSQMLVDTGVPQGSILGPLLFSIFINDILQLCTICHVHLYADDTFIYYFNPDISQIQYNLQQDFNIVQHWFNNNRLVLNMKKIMLHGVWHKIWLITLT